MKRAVSIACLSVLIVSTLTAIDLHRASKAKEAVLQEDRLVIRTAIDAYTAEKGKAPQSLDDLVKAGYLKAVPADLVFLHESPQK